MNNWSWRLTLSAGQISKYQNSQNVKGKKTHPCREARSCLCQPTDVHFIVHASLTSCAQDKSHHLHPSIFIWFILKSLFKFCLHEKRCKWSIQKLLQRQSSPSSASQGTVWGAARNNWKKSGEEDTRTSAEARTETGHIADSMRSKGISRLQTRRQRQKIDVTKVSSLRITKWCQRHWRQDRIFSVEAVNWTIWPRKSNFIRHILADFLTPKHPGV